MCFSDTEAIWAYDGSLYFSPVSFDYPKFDELIFSVPSHNNKNNNCNRFSSIKMLVRNFGDPCFFFFNTSKEWWYVKECFLHLFKNKWRYLGNWTKKKIEKYIWGGDKVCNKVSEQFQKLMKTDFTNLTQANFGLVSWKVKTLFFLERA